MKQQKYTIEKTNITGRADGGHYYSFIDVNQDGNNNLLNEITKENWLQFNDSHISEFDIDTISSERYGGSLDGLKIIKRYETLNEMQIENGENKD